MKRRFGGLLALGAALLLQSDVASASALGVEISTDRGHQAVYQPGDGMEVKVRVTDDAHVLVYEIDSEGYVRVLFPAHAGDDMLEGRTTMTLPGRESDIELVVEQSTGQSYMVAIASHAPFGPLPWYLRRPDAQGEELGYVNAPTEEEGITAEGQIVGDPFVSMERIRRAVLGEPEDADNFATAYTSYFVQHAVRYPRYLCYDCHRPNQYAFWDGFDPYYSSCSVFDFRVNWSWHWGPRYWYGTVPYFVYAYRSDCPPAYYSYYQSGAYYSSWDGWNRWCNLWGTGGLRRYKSPPPPGYVPPAQWKPSASRMPVTQMPPGFLVSDTRRFKGGSRPSLPIGRSGTSRDENAVRRPETGRPPTVGEREESASPVPASDRIPRGRSDSAPRQEGTQRDNPAPRPTPAPAPPVREPRQEPAPQRESTPPPPRGDIRPVPRSEPAREPRSDTQRIQSPRSNRTTWSAPASRGRSESVAAQLRTNRQAQPLRPSQTGNAPQAYRRSQASDAPQVYRRSQASDAPQAYRRNQPSSAPQSQRNSGTYSNQSGQSRPAPSAQRSNWGAPATPQRGNASHAPRGGGGWGGARSASGQR